MTSIYGDRQTVDDYWEALDHNAFHGAGGGGGGRGVPRLNLGPLGQSTPSSTQVRGQAPQEYVGNVTPRHSDEEEDVALLRGCHLNYQDRRKRMYRYRLLVVKYLMACWPSEGGASDDARQQQDRNLKDLVDGVFARVATKESLDHLSLRIGKVGFKPSEDPTFPLVERLHGHIARLHDEIAKSYVRKAGSVDDTEEKIHLEKLFQDIRRIQANETAGPQQVVQDIRGFAEQMLLPHVFLHGLVLRVSPEWEQLVGLKFQYVQQLVDLAYHPSPDIQDVRRLFRESYRRLQEFGIITAAAQMPERSWEPPEKDAECREHFQMFIVDLYVLFFRLARWEMEANTFLERQHVITKLVTERNQRDRVIIGDINPDDVVFIPTLSDAPRLSDDRSELVRADSCTMGPDQTSSDQAPLTILHVTQWILGYVQLLCHEGAPNDSTASSPLTGKEDEDADKYDHERHAFVKRFLDGMTDEELLELTDALNCRELNGQELTAVAEKTIDVIKQNASFQHDISVVWFRLAFDHSKRVIRSGVEAHEEVLESKFHNFLMQAERFITRSRKSQLHSHWPNTLNARVNAYVVSSLIDNAVRYSRIVDDESGQVIVEAGLRTDGYYHYTNNGIDGGPIYLTWSRTNTDEHGTDVYKMLQRLRAEGRDKGNGAVLNFSFLLDGEDRVEVQKNLTTNEFSSSIPLPYRRCAEIEVESSGEGNISGSEGVKVDSVRFVRLVMMAKFSAETRGIRSYEIGEQGKVIMACIQVERELTKLNKSAKSNKSVSLPQSVESANDATTEQQEGQLATTQQTPNNVIIPLLVQHHASPSLLKYLGATKLSDALKEMWRKPLGDTESTACRYILDNLPFSDSIGDTAFSPHDQGGAAAPLCKPIFITDAVTAHMIARKLQDSFHFPVDFMSINHACFTSKVNGIRALANSPIMTFLFATIDAPLAAHQLSEIVKIFENVKTQHQLRVVVTITPWLVNAWAEQPLVAFDLDAKKSTELVRTSTYNNDSRIGHLVVNSHLVDLAKICDELNNCGKAEALRRAYRVSTFNEHAHALVQLFEMLDASAALVGGRLLPTVSRFISFCVEGLAAGKLEESLCSPLPDGAEHRIVVFHVEERFRSTNWEPEVATAFDKAQSIKDARLVLVCKSPDCCGFDNLGYLAATLRRNKVVCDVVLPVKEHDLRYFQDPCKIADSNRSQVHAARMYYVPRDDLGLRGPARKGNCSTVDAPSFSFFVRNVPVCEFLSQRQSVALYERLFAISAGAACRQSAIENIDSTCGIGSTISVDGDGDDINACHPASPTRPQAEGSARYRMPTGDPGSVEVLCRGLAGSMFPWESCEAAWSSGFTLSNSVLFGIIMSCHFPLRILTCIPPTSLFSRLMILHKDCTEPWVHQMGARVSDKALTYFYGAFNDANPHANMKLVHQMKTAIAVVRWALVSVGCTDVPFSGEDFALVVGAKVIIDPAAVVQESGEDSPAAKGLIKMLAQLDGSEDEDARLLFAKQAKVREFFLFTMPSKLGSLIEGEPWGSALVGLLLGLTTQPSSPWARQSGRVRELLAWKHAMSFTEFSLNGYFCLTDAAMFTLVDLSADPTKLCVVLNAILSTEEDGDAGNRRLIEALLQRTRIGKAAEGDAWQPFELIRYLYEDGRPAAFAEACSHAVDVLPQTSSIRVVATILRLEQAGADSSALTNALLELGHQPRSETDVLLPVNSMPQLRDILVRFLSDAYFMTTRDTQALESLLRFTHRCLSESARCKVVNDTSPSTTEGILFALACWIHHPTIAFDVAEAKMPAVARVYQMLQNVGEVAAPFVSKFARIAQEQFYNVPLLALALTDQRDIMSDASYEFYSRALDWPPLERIVYLLVKQQDPYPSYYLSGSPRALSKTQREVLFGVGQIQLVDNAFLSDALNEHGKQLAAALHVRLSEGVTPATIRRNVEFLLFAPIAAQPQGKNVQPNARCRAFDMATIAMCVMTWFSFLGISGYDLCNAMQHHQMALQKRLQHWKAEAARVTFDPRLVFLPMPGTLDLRVRVCAGTVELFGPYAGDRLYTIRSLSQGLPATAQFSSNLPTNWTNEEIINLVADEAAIHVHRAQTAQTAAATARAFTAMVLFVWQQQKQMEAVALLRRFGASCFAVEATDAATTNNVMAAALAAFVSISVASEWSAQLMPEFLKSPNAQSAVLFKFPRVIASEVDFSNRAWFKESNGRIVKYESPHLDDENGPLFAASDASVDINWEVQVRGFHPYDVLKVQPAPSHPSQVPAAERTRTMQDAKRRRFFECGVSAASVHGGSTSPPGTSMPSDGLSSAAGGVGVSCASSLIRVVDIRSLVRFKVEPDRPFGYLCIKEGFQCYLAQCGAKGQYRIFTQQDATTSLTNVKTFSSYHRAWKFLMSLGFSGDHPPTLTLNGCFLTKGLNSRWLLFIAHPTADVRLSPAMVWHVIAFHSILHVQLLPEAIRAFTLMFRWTLEETGELRATDDELPLDALTRRLCQRTEADKHAERKRVFSKICDFVKQCLHHVAINYNKRAITEDVTTEVLLSLRANRNDVEVDGEGHNAAQNEVISSVLWGNKSMEIANKRRLELDDMLQMYLSRFAREALTEVVAAAHDETSERRLTADEPQSFLHGVYWNPCAILSICDPLVASLKHYEEAQRKYYAAIGATSDADIVINDCEIPADTQRSNIELIEPRFGRGRLVDSDIEHGNASAVFLDSVRADRSTFITDEVAGSLKVHPSVGYYLSNDIVFGRNTVGCFYDDNIVSYTASVHLKNSDPIERNSQITDLRRFLEMTLASPLDDESKAFFCQHLSTKSVLRIDDITPGIEALFNRGRLATIALLLGLAQTLPIPQVRSVVVGALRSKLTVHGNMFELCFRKNGKYGVHVIAELADIYKDSKLIHRVVSFTDDALPDAEKFEQIVERFDELVSHVIVKGLRRISDRLLKWLAEYTLSFPWRWVVLVKTSTHYNWPENRDRVYMPRLTDVVAEKIKPFKGHTKLIVVDLVETTETALTGMEQTLLREDWQPIANALNYAVTFVVSPPGAGKSKFTQALEASDKYMIFTVDCSNPILARESIKELLQQSFPKDNIKKALLVADEFHFLDFALKIMLFEWIRPRTSWLRALLIANRSDASDIKIMERLGLAVERPPPGAAVDAAAQPIHDDDAPLQSVLLIEGRCGMNKMIDITAGRDGSERKRTYVGAFHCMRRALFSDEVSTLRNREKIIESFESQQVDGVRALLCDQLVICEEFFPSLVAKVFHETMMDLLLHAPTDNTAQGQHLLRTYRACVGAGDAPRALVLCAMLPYYFHPNGGSPDAVLSFDEVCQRMNMEDVHPAYRFHLWCEYVHRYCFPPSGAPADGALQTCLAGLKQMAFTVQGFFPIIHAEQREYSKQVMVEAHLVPYHDLEELTDAIVRHKALDWDGIRNYWADHYVTDLGLFEKLLSALGENSSVCMTALARQNITMLIRGSTFSEDSFANAVLKFLASTVDEGALITCDSPWLMALWGFLKSTKVSEWRAYPRDALRGAIEKHGANCRSLCALALSQFAPVADPIVAIELLLFTWVSEYGSCFNEVAGDSDGCDACLRMTLSSLLHDVVAACLASEQPLPRRLEALVCGELAGHILLDTPSTPSPFTLDDACALVVGTVTTSESWPLLLQLMERVCRVDHETKRQRPLDVANVVALHAALEAIPRESIPIRVVAAMALVPEGSLPIEIQKWIAADPRELSHDAVCQAEHAVDEGVPQLRRNFVELARLVVNGEVTFDAVKWQGTFTTEMDWLRKKLAIF